MDDQTALKVLTRIFAEEAGRNNALTATLVGILSALKSYPEVVDAVRGALESQYSGHLATTHHQAYIDGFERVRDLVYTALGDG